jgi:hypothetical protein
LRQALACVFARSALDLVSLNAQLLAITASKGLGGPFLFIRISVVEILVIEIAVLVALQEADLLSRQALKLCGGLFQSLAWLCRTVRIRCGTLGRWAGVLRTP